jgi:hypothetical protein
VEKALTDWLEKTYPREVPTLREGEDPMGYALRCAMQSGRREVIDKLTSIYKKSITPSK